MASDPRDMIGGPGKASDGSRRRLHQLALVAAACLFVASTAPQPLFFAAFAGALTLGAIGAAVVATLRGERPALRAAVITHWDQAAALMAASLLARVPIDPEQVAAAIEAAQSAPGAG